MSLPWSAEAGPAGAGGRLGWGGLWGVAGICWERGLRDEGGGAAPHPRGTRNGGDLR